MISVLVFGFVIIVLGIIFGKLIRRELQTKQCPYCSCRDCCNIGNGIIAACQDQEQRPFMCMKK